MPSLTHLKLVRLPEQLERRKKPGFGRPYAREKSTHTAKLETQLNAAIQVQKQRRPPAFVDPALILRVQMTGPLLESDWEAAGLTVLSNDADRTLVLFANSDELSAFRNRLAAYGGPTPVGQKSAPYENFISSVESISAIEPSDRLGPKLREAGFNSLDDILPHAEFTVDLELWDLGRRDLRERKLSDIRQYVTAMEGEVYDEYIGPSITLLRLHINGIVLRALLSVEEVASIDLPPVPDLIQDDMHDLSLVEVPPVDEVPEDAPVIGIIDSGVNAHPLLADILVGAIGVPSTLGVADEWGHGTRVAGTAIFGDLRVQLESGGLTRNARICSAKVVNNVGAFDDKKLVPSQMREALTTLHSQFGCRIFVLSLGDGKSPYSGGKVGAWAATLDELARELDVLIVVSAGNRAPRGGLKVEEGVTSYPMYLIEPNNRILEPAGAANVLTVGALAHGNGMTQEMSDDIHIRPITERGEPAPFTRIGPGVNGSVKPDLIDFGGTMVYDAVTVSLKNGSHYPSAGLLTLHNKFVERLFSAGSGTSYAAPLVAFKASQLLTLMPTASANLLRALLANAAGHTDEMTGKIKSLSDNAVHNICGHGQVDVQRAAYSDEGRVVMYAEATLPVDHFAVYEIPIPSEFQANTGRRKVTVTLAYDPPVRHSRSDYLGIKMSFRLIRGCNAETVFEHYRKRSKDEGGVPELPAKYNCGLKPGPTAREKGTLQRASIEFARGIESYGDKYYLIVRCEGGWAAATELAQRFAVVVELSHESSIVLYDRLRARVRT